MKKLLFLSYTDAGGAGKANVNIAKAFISLGHEVQFLVRKKTTDEFFIKEIKIEKALITNKTIFNRIKNRLYFELNKQKKNRLSPPNLYQEKYCYYNENEAVSAFTFEQIVSNMTIEPNIVIGGWITYFVNFDTLGKIADHFGAQSFLLMNDMAHLTGGCHYNWNCEGYLKDCATCPALAGTDNHDRSKNNLAHKKDAVLKYNIQAIAGSKGNIIEIQSSTLFKDQKEVKMINGILDFSHFNTKKRNIAKEVFDISQSSKVILAGAALINDPRKGFAEFQKILEKLSLKLVESSNEITLIIVGDNNHLNFDFQNITVKKLESINNKILFSLLYQAADVFASPSVQDTGPVMVVEALASGTPVIGFQLGFVEDFVEDQKNGYVIPKFDIDLFAEKIFEILYFSDLEKLKNNAVNSMQNVFSIKQLENFF
ncbi:MAG: glycosyltransferase [Flavobacterium sp.]|nr:glycosyltransferase [Flavobacterium sp.]